MDGPVKMMVFLPEMLWHSCLATRLWSCGLFFKVARPSVPWPSFRWTEICAVEEQTPHLTPIHPESFAGVVCSLPNHRVSKMICSINLYGALSVGHEYFKQMSQQSVVVEMRFCGWGWTQLLNTLVPLKKNKNDGELGFRGKPLPDVKMSTHKQLAALLALTLQLLCTSWTALAWLASIYIIAFSY